MCTLDECANRMQHHPSITTFCNNNLCILHLVAWACATGGSFILMEIDIKFIVSLLTLTLLLFTANANTFVIAVRVFLNNKESVLLFADKFSKGPDGEIERT